MTPAELRAALDQLGLTQAELAHICDTDPRTVRKWVQQTGTDVRNRGVNPIAARIVTWMLDGFRPPEFPKR